MEKIKTKLEIMEAVNNIVLPKPNEKEIIARKISEEAIREYRNDITEDLEYQVGLKWIIKEAIIKGMDEWTKDMING